jgi:hypothetical protein
VELPQPNRGVEEPPHRLVDIPTGFHVEPKIAVELLGFRGELRCPCGVLL